MLPEDFRRKIIKVSLSPLLIEEGIVIAPVLNALCHWDSGQFKQREPDLEMQLKVSMLEGADPGTLCRAVHVRETGSQGSSSRETAAGAGPGAPGRSGLCAPLLPGHHRMAQDTNVLPGDQWN